MADLHAPRKLPFWLIASVLVNMLLIGLVGGVLLKREPGHRADAQQGMAHERPMMGLENTQDRREVRRIMHEAMRGASQEVMARREARKALSRALSAETYDPDATRAAFAEIRAADRALTQKLHADLEGGLAELTPQQRMAIARAIGRGGPSPRRREGRREGKR